MGPVNWLAVVLGALIAALLLFAWERGRGGARRFAALAIVTLIASTMLGHALARIGAEKLAEKPWLYAMQSGGLAIAFVIPALLVNGKSWRDCLPWLAAYLAMGFTFQLLA